MGWHAIEWSELFQNVGIVGGLFLSAGALFLERQARRAEALFKLTERHAAIWAEVFTNVALARVLDPGADTARYPVTELEVMHVTKLVLHLNSAHRMYRARILREPEGLTLDIRTFFELPVPRAAWARIRATQDRDLVAFVEERLGR
jgi:hypothetical protein